MQVYTYYAVTIKGGILKQIWSSFYMSTMYYSWKKTFQDQRCKMSTRQIISNEGSWTCLIPSGDLNYQRSFKTSHLDWPTGMLNWLSTALWLSARCIQMGDFKVQEICQNGLKEEKRWIYAYHDIILAGTVDGGGMRTRGICLWTACVVVKMLL